MNLKNKGNFYIFITAILWSTGGLLIKYIPINPVAINSARSLIALIFFAAYEKKTKIKLNKYVVVAALCLTMSNTLFVVANKLTTAANVIVLEYIAPIFVLIWDSIYHKRLPKKKQALCVAMAFGGMLLFFCDQLDGGRLMGNLIAIAAGVAFSGVYFVNSLPESSSADASMLAFLLSFLVGIPFFGDVVNLEMSGWAALLVLGAFQVGLAYVFYSKGSKLTSPVSASLIGLLEAILSPVWVWIFYGEKMGKFALIGALVIIAAVILNVLTGDSAEKENLQE